MPEPVAFKNLLTEDLSDYNFEPFREGVEICILHEGESTLALLKYAPGAKVPRHLHQGLETVFVLQGSQSDERGTYEAGCCVLNPTGYEHSVASEDGCVVLIQWAKAVKFV
jgi:anti-sigma factor ChrR (cupin superfamily)